MFFAPTAMLISKVSKEITDAEPKLMRILVLFAGIPVWVSSSQELYEAAQMAILQIRLVMEKIGGRRQ